MVELSVQLLLQSPPAPVRGAGQALWQAIYASHLQYAIARSEQTQLEYQPYLIQSELAFEVTWN